VTLGCHPVIHSVRLRASDFECAMQRFEFSRRRRLELGAGQRADYRVSNTISTRRFFARPFGSSEPFRPNVGCNRSCRTKALRHELHISQPLQLDLYTAAARRSDNSWLWLGEPLASVWPSIRAAVTPRSRRIAATSQELSCIGEDVRLVVVEQDVGWQVYGACGHCTVTGTCEIAIEPLASAGVRGTIASP
jgi:hypothetical protein